MAAQFGDVTRTKKDVVANIVSMKHEYQTCIMDASMRKAVLADSERVVKEDMQIIINKLQRMLKDVHNKARLAASDTVKAETEKLNDEILFLEEQHQSLEEMEKTVKETTSNTNLKPLKIGKEKCEYSSERLEQYRANISSKCARFVLHPLLAEILEHVETFAMGNIMLIQAPSYSNDEYTGNESDDVISDVVMSLQREQSKTTFMRSNSSKLNQTATNRNQLQTQQKLKAISKSTSDYKGTTLDKPEMKSKFIKRSNTDAMPRGKGQQQKEESNWEERYTSIAGLQATLTDRSASAPFISLPSKQKSTFVEKKDESPQMNISYLETLHTKRHSKGGCYITGLTTLVNGAVVLCDSVHDSLQLYDPDYKQVSELELPHPWGVTSVSDTAVAVSLHYDRKITLIKAEQQFERLNEKDIVLKCNASLLYDLKYYEFRIYALCIDSDVHILDLKGRQYGVVKTGISINTLKFLDVDIEKKTVVISGDNGVACLNFQGLPLWHYKCPSKAKFTPTGITLFKDTILVCDWENGNLVEIYEDGHKTRTVVSDSIEHPMALCRCDSKNILFVSQGDYDMADEKARMVKVLLVKDKSST